MFMMSSDVLNNTALFDRYHRNDHVYEDDDHDDGALPDQVDGTNFTFDFSSYVAAVMFKNTYEQNVEIFDYIDDVLWSRDILHEVIAMDDCRIIALMKARGIEFQIDDIIFAIECFADTVALYLLVNVDISAAQYRFILRTAAICNLIRVVRAVIAKVPDIETNEALLVAVDHDNIDIVECLIQHTDQSVDNYSATLHAGFYRKAEMLQLLMNHDISVETVNMIIIEIFKNQLISQDSPSIIDNILRRFPVLATNALVNAIGIFDIESLKICLRYDADLLQYDKQIYQYICSSDHHQRDVIYNMLAFEQISRILEVAIGLAALDFPVLVVLTIIEQMFETKHDDRIIYTSSVYTWSLLRNVKHAKN